VDGGGGRSGGGSGVEEVLMIDQIRACRLLGQYCLCMWFVEVCV